MSYEWNLTSLFKSDTDPLIEVEKANLRNAANNFVTTWEQRTDWLNDAEKLAEILTDYNNWLTNFGYHGKVGYYFSLRASQDSSDPFLKAAQSQINELSTEITNKMQFLELRLAKIETSKQDDFLKDEKLTKFKHFLERIFQRSSHLLSEPEEKIMNLFAFQPDKWSSMLKEFLSGECVDFEEIKSENATNKSNLLDEKDNQNSVKKLTVEGLLAKISDSDQNTRNQAAELFNQVLEKHKKVAEHELNAILQHKKVTDELQKYEKPDSARLAADGVEPAILDNLLDAVKNKLNLSRNYYKLKARLSGKEKLAYHERNVEYGNLVKTYTFEEAIVILKRVFAKLDGQSGTDFSDIFENYLQNGQIDAFPRVGKRGGAFMTGNDGRIVDPTFIFLNYTGTLDNIQIFAHEMGHACNFEMMKKTELAINWNNSYLIMESPSTFMEDFVLEDILEKTTDKKEKLSILMKKLNDDTSIIFRQLSIYLFELELHETFRKIGYLSAEKIGEIFSNHMENYMGDAVEKSDGSENWWIYIQHIRYMFYVYSYASGLLISKFMQNKYKQNPAFMAEIKEFYKSGESKSVVQVLQEVLKIDAHSPEIWQMGLEQTEQLLKEAESLATELQLI